MFVFVTEYEEPEAGLSNSIGAVRWNLPDEGLQAHSSVPSKSSQSPRQKVHKKIDRWVGGWRERGGRERDGWMDGGRVRDGWMDG